MLFVAGQTAYELDLGLDITAFLWCKSSVQVLNEVRVPLDVPMGSCLFQVRERDVSASSLVDFFDDVNSSKSTPKVSIINCPHFSHIQSFCKFVHKRQQSSPQIFCRSSPPPQARFFLAVWRRKTGFIFGSCLLPLDLQLRPHRGSESKPLFALVALPSFLLKREGNSLLEESASLRKPALSIAQMLQILLIQLPAAPCSDLLENHAPVQSLTFSRFPTLSQLVRASKSEGVCWEQGLVPAPCRSAPPSRVSNFVANFFFFL